MSSELKTAILAKNQKRVKNITAALSEEDNWSLISLLDELTPMLLMESNLRYGSFHIIKMSLFLREMTIKNYFNRTTEKKLLEKMALNFCERGFIPVGTEQTLKQKQSGAGSVKKLVDELAQGNVHNAFYYALSLLENEPQKLCEFLLQAGALFIGDSLGHSLSCFYPVVKDLIALDSPHTETALLNNIMYLGRYDFSEQDRKHLCEIPVAPDVEGSSSARYPQDFNSLVFRCASGSGIVNLHHMITLAIFILWENGDIGSSPPYGRFLDWLGDKKVDTKQKDLITAYDLNVAVPDSYQEFTSEFSFNDLETSMETFFAILKNDYRKAVDWLFRIYTENLSGAWNPHYFTSLYTAFFLYLSADRIDNSAGRMAIYQAVKYFSANLMNL